MPFPGTIPGAGGTVKRIAGDHSVTSSGHASASGGQDGAGVTEATWTYQVPGAKRSPACHEVWRGFSGDSSFASGQKAFGFAGSERANWIMSAVESAGIVHEIVGFP